MSLRKSSYDYPADQRYNTCTKGQITHNAKDAAMSSFALPDSESEHWWMCCAKDLASGKYLYFSENGEGW